MTKSWTCRLPHAINAPDTAPISHWPLGPCDSVVLALIGAAAYIRIWHTMPSSEKDSHRLFEAAETRRSIHDTCNMADRIWNLSTNHRRRSARIARSSIAWLPWDQPQSDCDLKRVGYAPRHEVSAYRDYQPSPPYVNRLSGSAVPQFDCVRSIPTGSVAQYNVCCDGRMWRRCIDSIWVFTDRIGRLDACLTPMGLIGATTQLNPERKGRTVEEGQNEAHYGVVGETL
ncbi:hypothetical protein BO94DRAFT_550664 [Aspergillus sclerotioniger CBS 115572]|uniref:Uncharacterized protein n=1 Tax=Aspergillus sclerotioniger CBS 115572 TaxID=1450535 RepID=A0A317V891_9EURO|nr:hypothetical protein BO94DRAFT_550664 [Aspergillus sclerotioniger CBS 115572]PWY70356.1 hypothetical protein BO94DRAFT_550664 [Aspergillus sclerotioniger CBS 115572]